MCMMCDGFSYEEAMRSIDLSIRIHGWHLTMVDAPMPWCYTIGLTETFGHSELVVVDIEIADEERLVRWAVGMIERDGSLDSAELTRRQVEVVPVHDRHLRGEWFATWANHYGETPPTGSFLQVVPPPDWFCECHQHLTRRLDRPDGRPLANRAARRRQQRSTRR